MLLPTSASQVEIRTDTTAHQRSNRKKRKARKKRRLIFFGVLSVILVLCLAAAVTLLILYSGVRIQYCMELGTALPSADVFAKTGDVTVSYITEPSTIDIASTGSHWIHVSADGKDRLVNLLIQDTVAPHAEPVDLNISVDDSLTVDQLVSNLSDQASVRLLWDKAPVFGTVGDYPVVVTMKDASGNTAAVTSTVHIRAVVDSVSYETGSDLPPLSEFLVKKDLKASFLTDISALPLNTPGDYKVDIEVNGVTYTSHLIDADTVAPAVTAKLVWIRPGENAKPDAFIATATDASALSYEFTQLPDFNKTGAQPISIVAKDLGGNTAQVDATLLISNAAPITVEARDTALTINEFGDMSAYTSAVLTGELIPNTLGEHVVELNLDGEINPSVVTVVDTTPPVGVGVDATWYLNHPITAERLVKNESDYTNITYSFAAEPDWTKAGTQNVTVVLTDAAGNATQVASTLTLAADTEPPTLFGVMDRYAYIGQAVAYFAEVFAQDNCDGQITANVDNSLVDIYHAGTYPVKYTAVDSSGNTVEKSCSFTFVDQTVSDDELNTTTDAVLAEITTPDMSIGHKAYAIYKYVYNHVKYNGSSRKDDWKYEAYRGITTGRGDCFTFYATAKCLLERIGAQTMCVERHGGKDTHHYWLLVNLGTGWYHFDAINVGPQNFECFMRTDSDLLARSTYFWSFDRSLYPPSPTEDYVLN